MPEMRTVNRVVLTGICAYVFIGYCWLLTRSPVSLPANAPVRQAPPRSDVRQAPRSEQVEAVQALKDLIKLILVVDYIIQHGLYPLLGKPIDLQDTISAIDRL